MAWSVSSEGDMAEIILGEQEGTQGGDRYTQRGDTATPCPHPTPETRPPTTGLCSSPQNMSLCLPPTLLSCACPGAHPCPQCPPVSLRLVVALAQLGGRHEEGVEHGHALGQHGDLQPVLLLWGHGDRGQQGSGTSATMGTLWPWGHRPPQGLDLSPLPSTPLLVGVPQLSPAPLPVPPSTLK